MKPLARFSTNFVAQLTVYTICNVMAIINLSGDDNTELIPLIGVEEQKHIPYQAGILYDERFKCGATLLSQGSDQFILTAARCVGSGEPPTNIPVRKNMTKVFVESTNILHVENITQIREVAKIVIHPCFSKKRGKYPNNIAIIFPERNFDLNENVKPAHLPPNKGYKIPKFVTVSGYGNSEWGEEGDGELRKLEMPTVDWDLCRNSKPVERQFCAGFLKEGGKGICEGDEGGPAMGYDANGGMNFYLAGIISHIPYWTKSCGDGHTLSLFTDVSLYLDWIKIEIFKRMRPMENKTCEINN